MRRSSPKLATDDSSQFASACAGDVAVGEDRRAVGVEPGRDQDREQVEGALAQVGGVVVDADRVQVDDAEERLALLLGRGVLAEPAGVVAEVLGARGLDPGKDPHGSILSFRGVAGTRPPLRTRGSRETAAGA